MSCFEERWRLMVRSARGAPEPPVPPVPARLLLRPLPGPAPEIRFNRRQRWAFGAALAALWLIALPFISPTVDLAAAEPWKELRVPTASAIPPPPVPPPPSIPSPLSLLSYESINSFFFPPTTSPEREEPQEPIS